MCPSTAARTDTLRNSQRTAFPDNRVRTNCQCTTRPIARQYSSAHIVQPYTCTHIESPNTHYPDRQSSSQCKPSRSEVWFPPRQSNSTPALGLPSLLAQDTRYLHRLRTGNQCNPILHSSPRLLEHSTSQCSKPPQTSSENKQQNSQRHLPCQDNCSCLAERTAYTLRSTAQIAQLSTLNHHHCQQHRTQLLSCPASNP